MIQIDRERDALVIADLQPDFMPGGALSVPDGDRIVEPIARVLSRFATIVATQDWHPPGHVSFASAHPGSKPFEAIPLYGGNQILWPDHCVQGSPGAALHQAFPTAPLTMILRKGTSPRVDAYSAFRENVGPDGARRATGLAGWLAERGVRRVFVCGLARDFCVRASAEDAAAAGFESIVLEDLTRSVFPDRAAETTALLEEAGCRFARSGDL